MPDDITYSIKLMMSLGGDDVEGVLNGIKAIKKYAVTDVVEEVD